MPIHLPHWFSKVRKNLCHRTGVEALRKILATGAILPNDGSFPDTYPQSKYSFARVYKMVSLFDFENQSNDETLYQIHNWYRFFFDHNPVTIVILLDRKQLAAKLIPNAKAMEITQGTFEPIFIPHVEVFYPESIPCDAFVGYLIICGVYETIYEYIPYGEAAPEVFEKIDDFVKQHQSIYSDPLSVLEKDLEK